MLSDHDYEHKVHSLTIPKQTLDLSTCIFLFKKAKSFIFKFPFWFLTSESIHLTNKIAYKHFIVSSACIDVLVLSSLRLYLETEIL